MHRRGGDHGRARRACRTRKSRSSRSSTSASSAASPTIRRGADHPDLYRLPGDRSPSSRRSATRSTPPASTTSPSRRVLFPPWTTDWISERGQRAAARLRHRPARARRRPRLPAMRLDRHRGSQPLRLDPVQGAMALQRLPGAVRPLQVPLVEQRQQREARQPMLAHIVAGDVRQRRVEMRVGGVAGELRLVGRAAAAPGSRQHQARLRLSPSRWAILPSLRSLTMAGREQASPARARARSRQEAAEPAVELGCRQARAPCTAPRSAPATGIRRRPAPTPGSRGRRRTSRCARSRISVGQRAGRTAPPIRAPGPARRRVLKWVPTRIG